MVTKTSCCMMSLLVSIREKQAQPMIFSCYQEVQALLLRRIEEFFLCFLDSKWYEFFVKLTAVRRSYKENFMLSNLPVVPKFFSKWGENEHLFTELHVLLVADASNREGRRSKKNVQTNNVCILFLDYSMFGWNVSNRRKKKGKS